MLPADDNNLNREAPSNSRLVPAKLEGSSLRLADEAFESGELAPFQVMNAPSLLPDAATMLRALRRRWLITLILGITLSAIGVISGYRLLPIKYTAQVRFHISTRAPSILSQSQDGGGDLANFERTQVELIKSEPVLNVALQRPEIADLAVVREQSNPAAWLKQDLKGEFPAPEILRVSLTGKNGREIQLVLDTITEAYLQEVVNKERNERLSKLALLKGILKEREENLRKKRDAFHQRARSTVSGDAQVLAFSHRLALERLAKARTELLQIQSDLRRAEIELKVRQKSGDQSVSPPIVRDIDIEDQLDQDKTIADLRARNMEIANLIKRVQSRFSDGGQSMENNNRSMRELRSELKTNEDALAARTRELRPRIVRRLASESRGIAPNATAQLADQVAVLRDLEKQLTADITRLSAETREINDSSLDLDEMRDDIVQIDTMTKTVASRAEAIQVELDAPTRVAVLEKATVAQTTTESKRLAAAGGAGFAGWCLAIFGVLGWELRSRRILHPVEISHGLKIRLLGTLPVRARQETIYAPSLPSPGSKYPGNFFAESVDRTAVKLMHTARQETLRVILITSALSGEGKSSLASHLGLSLARSGKRVLLIDADLRRPTLHRLFDLELEPGLSAVFRDESTVLKAIRPTLMMGLEVIPAGRGDQPAIQALGGDRFRMMLGKVQGVYDFIIVDSAPVLAVIDATVIAQHVDGVLFSVLCGVSQLHSIHQCYQELNSIGVRILGAVVSGVDSHGIGYGYHYGNPGER
jgi:capsular exopolysaccharide synthesis family protein